MTLVPVHEAPRLGEDRERPVIDDPCQHHAAQRGKRRRLGGTGGKPRHACVIEAKEDFVRRRIKMQAPGVIAVRFDQVSAHADKHAVGSLAQCGEVVRLGPQVVAAVQRRGHVGEHEGENVLGNGLI